MNAEELINAYLEGESASDLVDLIVEGEEMDEEELEEFKKHKRVSGAMMSRTTGKRKDIRKSKLMKRKMKSAGAKRAMQKGAAMWRRAHKAELSKIGKFAAARRG